MPLSNISLILRIVANATGFTTETIVVFDIFSTFWNFKDFFGFQIDIRFTTTWTKSSFKNRKSFKNGWIRFQSSRLIWPRWFFCRSTIIIYNELLPWHKFLDKGLLKHFVPPVTNKRISNISNLLNIFKISFRGILSGKFYETKNTSHLQGDEKLKILFNVHLGSNNCTFKPVPIIYEHGNLKKNAW